jgi:hypothetical protein
VAINVRVKRDGGEGGPCSPICPGARGWLSPALVHILGFQDVFIFRFMFLILLNGCSSTFHGISVYSNNHLT